MNPLTDLIQAVAASTDYLERVETAARKARRRHRGMLTVWVVGAICSVVSGSRVIELREPWYLITMSVLITAAWTITASREWTKLRKAGELVEECWLARLAMSDHDFRAFLDIFNSPAARTVAPDVAPTTPEGTTP